MRIYLDNAATTPLAPEVFESMKPYMLSHFGNPSSIHADGRIARSAIEQARKSIAQLIGASPSEVFFTSSGTESDNMAIGSGIAGHQITHAISSPIEHHAVLHTLEHWASQNKIKLSLLELNVQGNIDLGRLEELLLQYPKSLVSLMHGNNEIGNMNDIAQIGRLCRANGALFHCDAVQTMGHYPHNVGQVEVDFLAASAHKFHGPKGVGFLYVNSRVSIPPMIFGGAQERNMRGGTENVSAIIGMATALEMACKDLESHKAHILTLKKTFIERLKAQLPESSFNGLSFHTDPDKSLYTVVNVSLPPSALADMLLFSLDINGVSASGGSACSSGSEVGSHVLEALNKSAITNQKINQRPSIRFSFSRYNTIEEIEKAVDILANLYKNDK